MLLHRFYYFPLSLWLSPCRAVSWRRSYSTRSTHHDTTQHARQDVSNASKIHSTVQPCWSNIGYTARLVFELRLAIVVAIEYGLYNIDGGGQHWPTRRTTPQRPFAEQKLSRRSVWIVSKIVYQITPTRFSYNYQQSIIIIIIIIINVDLEGAHCYKDISA